MESAEQVIPVEKCGKLLCYEIHWTVSPSNLCVCFQHISLKFHDSESCIQLIYLFNFKSLGIHSSWRKTKQKKNSFFETAAYMHFLLYETRGCACSEIDNSNKKKSYSRYRPDQMKYTIWKCLLISHCLYREKYIFSTILFWSLMILIPLRSSNNASVFLFFF